MTTNVQANDDYIGSEQGLSNRHVTCILQDHFGLIWVGTANGLNLYDGYSFKNYFPFSKGISLSNARINCMAEDMQGNLWVGTNAGLNRISADRSSATVVSELRNSGIVCIKILPDGKLILGTTVGEIKTIDPSGEMKTIYKDGREIAINGLSVDHEGFTWFYTNSERKLYKLNPDHLRDRAFHLEEPISCNFLLSNQRLISSFPGRTGIQLASSKTGGFFKNAFLDSLDGLFGAASLLFEDRDHKLWCAYKAGVLLQINLEQGKVKSFSNFFRRAYFGSAITAIYQDQNGMMWVGTDGGLVKISTSSLPFKGYLSNPNPNEPENFISTRGIAEDRSGNIYFGSYKGLYELNLKTQKNQRFLKDGKDIVVAYRIINQDDHTLLLTTIQYGLQYFDTRTKLFSSAAVLTDPIDKELYGLFKDHKGTIWVGTRKGLKWVDGKTNTLVKYVDGTKNEALVSSTVYDIKESPEGIFWVATSKGLLKIDASAGKVKHYTTHSMPSVSSKEILSITLDLNTLWIGSHGGGLMKMDMLRDSITYYNTSDGLSGSIVYSILRDGKYCWMSTEKGISRMDVGTGQFKNYRERDGLTDNEFNSASYLQASDGRIYFGGINGINAFYPNEITEGKAIDKIILTSLKRNHNELRNQMTGPDQQSITLPNDDRNLSVQFALTDFYRPQENHFYYRIKGIDPDWVNIGTQNFLLISQLPAGQYELLIKGKNQNDQESVNQISLILNVEQVFYKTQWFVTLIVLIFLGAVYIFFRMKIAQLHRMQRMRTKIASDLHDEVGGMLTRISILTEVLKFKNKDQEEVAQIAIASRQATTTMSDVLWSVDARNDKMGNLVDRMREHADALLLPLHIALLFESTLDERKFLEMQTRQNVLLIFKEAIHNIAKHSQATEVIVRLMVENKVFTLTIHDNGKNPATKNGTGQGLKNMTMRAQEIGGMLKIITTNGYQIAFSKEL